MFGFLLQEEWWMDTIIAACITAVVTLIASYFAYLGKLGKLEYKLDLLLGDKHNQLREDEARILQSGDKLSQEHDKLKDILDKMFMNQEMEKASRSASGKYIPDEGKLVDLVQIVYHNHEKLIQENRELYAELSRLRAEMDKSKQFGMEMYTENAEELEIGD